jgi:hypothetical protein
VLYYEGGAFCIVNKPYDIRTADKPLTTPTAAASISIIDNDVTLEKLTYAAVAKLEAEHKHAPFTPPLRPCHQVYTVIHYHNHLLDW